MLDGELVAAVDTERCSLTLIAACIPPFGEVGRQLDRSLIARVGVSTVHASRPARLYPGGFEGNATRRETLVALNQDACREVPARRASPSTSFGVIR